MGSSWSELKHGIGKENNVKDREEGGGLIRFLPPLGLFLRKFLHGKLKPLGFSCVFGGKGGFVFSFWTFLEGGGKMDISVIHSPPSNRDLGYQGKDRNISVPGKERKGKEEWVWSQGIYHVVWVARRFFTYLLTSSCYSEKSRLGITCGNNCNSCVFFLSRRIKDPISKLIVGELSAPPLSLSLSHFLLLNGTFQEGKRNNSEIETLKPKERSKSNLNPPNSKLSYSYVVSMKFGGLGDGGSKREVANDERSLDRGINDVSSVIRERGSAREKISKEKLAGVEFWLIYADF